MKADWPRGSVVGSPRLLLTCRLNMAPREEVEDSGVEVDVEGTGGGKREEVESVRVRLEVIEADSREGGASSTSIAESFGVEGTTVASEEGSARAERAADSDDEVLDDEGASAAIGEPEAFLISVSE